MPRTTPSRPFATAGGSTCAHMPAHGVTCAPYFTFAATSSLQLQECRRAEQHPSLSCSPIWKFHFELGPITPRHRLPVLQGLSKSEEASSCSWLANAAMLHLPWRTLSTHWLVFHDMPQTKHPDTGLQAKVVMHCVFLTCLAGFCLLYRDLAQTRQAPQAAATSS
jgi:hypothetical protein